ncbi:MAG: hypothetical protein ACR2JX_00460 [Mycobacteriales bacterium]
MPPRVTFSRSLEVTHTIFAQSCTTLRAPGAPPLAGAAGAPLGLDGVVVQLLACDLDGVAAVAPAASFGALVASVAVGWVEVERTPLLSSTSPEWVLPLEPCLSREPCLRPILPAPSELELPPVLVDGVLVGMGCVVGAGGHTGGFRGLTNGAWLTLEMGAVVTFSGVVLGTDW